MTAKESKQGFWWRPENPETKLVGTALYGPCEGITLELVGSLTPLEEIGRPPQRFDVWGLTVGGKPITLFRAYQTNTGIHLPGYPTSRIEASQAVIGGHYRKPEDVFVHTIEIQFQYLSGWSQTSGITVQHQADNSSNISLKAEEPIVLADKNGIKVSAIPSMNMNHHRDGLEIKEWCELRLESGAGTPRPITEFDPIIHAFQRFLSLAVGESASPAEISAKTPDEAARIGDKPFWREISLVRKLSLRDERRKVEPEEMLFTLRDLQRAQQSIFGRFLEQESRLEAVFDLFFPTYFFDLPPPQELLNMAHAIEAFHRATIGGQYLGDAEYENGLKQSFLAAVPLQLSEDFRNSLKRRIDFLHEYSLKKRLKDILRKFDPLVAPYVGERDTFIRAVTEARNQLVHASRDNPPPDYRKLWRFAQQLGLVLEVAILSEIGFQQNEVRDIVARGKRAKLIRSNVF